METHHSQQFNEEKAAQLWAMAPLWRWLMDATTLQPKADNAYPSAPISPGMQKAVERAVFDRRAHTFRQIGENPA